MLFNYSNVVIIIFHDFFKFKLSFICIHALCKNFRSVFNKGREYRLGLVEIMLYLFNLTCFAVMRDIIKSVTGQHFMKIKGFSTSFSFAMLLCDFVLYSFNFQPIFVVFIILVDLIWSVLNCINMSTWFDPSNVEVDFLILLHLLGYRSDV